VMLWSATALAITAGVFAALHVLGAL